MKVTKARRATLGAVAGVLAGGAALGVGQFVAGLTGASSSPVVAVGQLQIDFTPPWLKNWAITHFGSDDKLVLVTGILVVLGLFAACIGAIATRRLAYGLAGMGIFAAVGLTASATRPTATFGSMLPTLAAIATAVVVLLVLERRIAPLSAAAELSGDETAGDELSGTEHSGNELSGPGLSGSGLSGSGLSGDELAAPDLPRATRTPAVPSSAGPARPPWASRAPVAVPEPRRRSFLVAGAVTVGVAAVAGLAGRMLTERSSVAKFIKTLRIPAPVKELPPLPARVNLNVPGISSFITSDSQFYRVDTAIVLPQVNPDSWQLRIHGMVSREITLTFDDLIRRPLIEDYITLCCVSNPVAGPYVGNALWLGASLSSVLREAGIKAGADQLMCTSIDGFTSGTPIQTVMDGRDALLAVAMNGQPLPVAHGFPARMVVPGLYGYVSATKWVTDIEVTTFAGNYAYWAQRGWSQQAPIKTESRIDVPTGNGPLKTGTVTVAGVAWAQHKGIDAVEVQIDNGPWHIATLAEVPGLDCWRQWAWNWEATSGNHIISARATDDTGYTQTGVQAPPDPNGASGYPQIQVTVT